MPMLRSKLQGRGCSQQPMTGQHSPSPGLHRKPISHVQRSTERQSCSTDFVPRWNNAIVTTQLRFQTPTASANSKPRLPRCAVGRATRCVTCEPSIATWLSTCKHSACSSASRNNKSQSFSLSFPNRREWYHWLDSLDVDRFVLAPAVFDGRASRDQCG